MVIPETQLGYDTCVLHSCKQIGPPSEENSMSERVCKIVRSQVFVVRTISFYTNQQQRKCNMESD